VTRAKRQAERARAGLSRVRHSRLVSSSAGAAFLTFADLILGLVVAVLLAQSLGVAGLGAYSLALASVVLAGLPVEFGLPTLIVREIAGDAGKPKPGAVKGVLVFAITVIGIMSTVVIFLALTLAETIVSGMDATARAMLPVAVAVVPLSALCNLFGFALMGRQKVALGMMPQRLIRPGLFALLLGGAAIVEPGWLTPVRAMGLQLCAVGAAMAFGAFHFWRQFAPVLSGTPAAIAWRPWCGAMLRLGVSTGIHLAQAQVLLLLTGLLGGAEAAGLLRVAQRGAALASLGVGIVTTAISPQLARLHAEDQRDSLQRLLIQGARASGAMAAAVLVCFLFGGVWLLGTVFGAEFVAAWGALIILTATEAARAQLGLGTALMNMVRREGVTAAGYSISLAVSMLGAVVLIPSYGVGGAAWATSFGLMAMSVYIWRRAWRDLGVNPAVIGFAARRGEPEDKA
jgi:O-antigen/teichoic acid export membrane protein